MDFWIEEFKRILRECGIVVYLLTKYVDDIFVICRTVELNQNWNGQGIRTRISEDNTTRGLTKQQHTLNILIEIANSILGCLQFTGEDSTDAPIAVLDTQFWMGNPSC